MEKIVREVYPKGKINKHCPGYTGDLIIRIHGKQIHSQEKDGKVDEKNIDQFVRKLQRAVNGEIEKQEPVNQAVKV